MFDRSTLTNPTPTTAQATITAINYNTQTVTLDAVPGWLTEGDYMTLDAYDTTRTATNSAVRLDRYIWIADSSFTLGSTSAEPYRWGR